MDIYSYIRSRDVAEHCRKYNPARREMARMILEAYGCSENSWIDSHAEKSGEAPLSVPTADPSEVISVEE